MSYSTTDIINQSFNSGLTFTYIYLTTNHSSFIIISIVFHLSVSFRLLEGKEYLI